MISSADDFLQAAADVLDGYLRSAAGAGRLQPAEVVAVDRDRDRLVVTYRIAAEPALRWALRPPPRLPRTDEAARDFAADAYDGFREHLADEAAGRRRSSS